MYLPGRRKDNSKEETAEYHKSVPLVLEFGGLTTRAGNPILIQNLSHSFIFPSKDMLDTRHQLFKSLQ